MALGWFLVLGFILFCFVSHAKCLWKKRWQYFVLRREHSRKQFYSAMGFESLEDMSELWPFYQWA